MFMAGAGFTRSRAVGLHTVLFERQRIVSLVEWRDKTAPEERTAHATCDSPSCPLEVWAQTCGDVLCIPCTSLLQCMDMALW